MLYCKNRHRAVLWYNPISGLLVSSSPSSSSSSSLFYLLFYLLYHYDISHHRRLYCSIDWKLCGCRTYIRMVWKFSTDGWTYDSVRRIFTNKRTALLAFYVNWYDSHTSQWWHHVMIVFQKIDTVLFKKTNEFIWGTLLQQQQTSLSPTVLPAFLISFVSSSP